MKSSNWLIPGLVSLGATLVGCLLPVLAPYPGFNFLRSLEWDSYDWRLRRAALTSDQSATNLAALYLDEASIEYLSDRLKVTWPFSRQVHGRIVRELRRQGARAVAFDVLFTGLRPMDAPVPREDGTLEEADDFFVRQMQEAGNVFIADGFEAEPAPEFAGAAAGVGSILAPKDGDGVLRRIRPVEVDESGNRRWHLGVLVAARELGVDLDQAIIDTDSVTLFGTNGVSRVLPLDEKGMMLIDWNIAWDDARLLKLSYGIPVDFDLAREIGGDEGYRLLLNEYRSAGLTELSGDLPLADRLVIVGSVAEGNNITDRGATPFSEDTPLVSTHFNVANTILMERFVRPISTGYEILIVFFASLLAARVTWHTQIVQGALWMLALGLVWIVVTIWLFTQMRIWAPMVVPLIGGLLIPYLSLATYRVVFGEREQRRIKHVFKSIVSPNVVNELLEAESLSLGGARRNITVFFADVRGFTEMTDSTQMKVERMVQDRGLTGEAAEAVFDRSAREVLETVNLYLATIADVIKKHDGTLDKYIGDCVMAFWGAPTENPQHAVACVRAAVEAQRAIYQLNQERAVENQRRKDQSGGEGEVELLPLLTLGTGINSGMATVGLMGSSDHISNYTVFGREVNLASRLEGFSGRGRIIIGENTFADLKRFAPDLAATCVQQAPASFKGFRESLVTYEVPWRDGLPGTVPTS